MTKPMNVSAIENASGRTWAEWVSLFEAAGGHDLDHKALVTTAVQELTGVVDKVGWWAQGTAIAYEQHIGRRVPGQGSDGEFRAGATKTFVGDVAEAEDAWHAIVDGVDEVGGIPFDGEPTTSETPKRRYWRVRLADGSRVAVAFESAGAAGKTRIAVEHTKLPDADAIDGWKATWKELLGRTTASV